MKTSRIRSGTRAMVSILTLLGVTVFGFAGVGGRASAATATITNTGPDSDNKIILASHTDCTVENNNDISIDNDVDQHARTGDATVAGNTISSSWGAWDPAVWQNKGYSYEQWSAAFHEYMASHQSEWQDNWGSLRGGGSATSGNATNTSTAEFNVSIDNGGCELAGAPGSHNPDNPQGGSSSSQNPHVLGAEHEGKGGGFGAGENGIGGAGGEGGVFGVQGGMGAGSSSNRPGGSTPGGNGGGSVSGGCEASIDTTGPDSSNKIVCGDTRQTTVSNTNNINVTNNVTQNAISGDATTGHNTSADGSGTGGANNSEASSLQLSAVN